MTVQRIPTDHAGGKWLFCYTSAINDTGTLAVDLNYMFRVPLWPVVQMDSRQVGSYRATGIRVVDVHELAAGKLAALLRGEPAGIRLMPMGCCAERRLWTPSPCGWGSSCMER